MCSAVLEGKSVIGTCEIAILSFVSQGRREGRHSSMRKVLHNNTKRNNTRPSHGEKKA